VVGRFSDKLGRKPVYAAGAVLAAVWGFVAFPLFDTKNDWLIVGILIVGLIIHALMYAGQPAIMAEMFPTRMRYSGVSLGYQVTSIFAGSLAPIIATMLLSSFGTWVPVAIYLALAAGVTLVAVAALRETAGIALRDIDAADREKLAETVDV
jgi:MFS family permease